MPEKQHIIKFARRGETEFQEYGVEEFEAIAGHCYIPQLEFESEKIYERIKKQCSRALEVGSVGEDSKWLGVLHAEALKNHAMADVSIRWVDETIGYGLFAESNLSTGDFIGEYAGVVRKINIIYGTINEYCFAYPTSAFSFRKHIIDARWKGNEIRYANHSETPNCESMGVVYDEILHIILRAIKDIRASEELTYDYSGYYWLTKRKWFHF